MATFEIKCVSKDCAKDAPETVTAEPFANGGTKCPDCGKPRLVRPVGKDE
jgi:DNA-directed RNA polymerase subunit RPC12/RpoP